ncbi:MAG TPA: pyrroline-5-carboxylate reductase, partial [Vineibacter sp.]|nr:pyrroline-5-carboxylate reductase [Vineibacter sp.]
IDRDPIRVAVLGCGNMGAALARGLAASDGIQVLAIDPDTDRARGLLGDAPVTLRATLAALDEERPPVLVVLAVKPQALPVVLPALAPVLPAETAVVSIAAGTPCASLRAALGSQRPVFRAMPNMPALVGRGMTVMYADGPREDARALCQRVFATVGQTAWVTTEAQIDLATAVSGSGPAYVFAFVEQFACAAARIGLPVALADALARATVIGAAGMLAQSEGRVEALKAAVTSPGGTTRAALDVLEGRHALPSLMKRTLAAALRRARELARADGGRPIKLRLKRS